MTALAAEPLSVPRPQARFNRIASVFLVDRIEPCLPFWTDRLGFEIRLQVAGEDRLDFVILGRDDVELMYRTRDNASLDSPALADGQAHGPWVVIYLEVDSLDDLMPMLEGLEIVEPLRETILGTKEIYVREPSGRIVALTSRG